MLEWLYANLANILVLVFVSALIALAVVSMVRDRKAGKSSCGCNCAKCAMAGKCHSAAKAKKN